MKKILIVDDEKNIRKFLDQCLKKEYEVKAVMNGAEALEILEKEKYDLVFLDINMPIMDGMEALEKISKKGINVSVIMMTAYGTIERAVEAMKLGAVDFINKPFTVDEITELVNKVFQRESLREESVTAYEEYLEYAKKCILERDYENAVKFLEKAVSKNISMPEPHNLIGAVYELKSDMLQAKKHYRVALDLDPTYLPAKENLHRSSSSLEYSGFSDIKLGEFGKKGKK